MKSLMKLYNQDGFKKTLQKSIILIFAMFFTNSISAQFVHPGITHKKSDLDRMKYMVKAKMDPWYTSYQEMSSDSKASYNYDVQGDPSFTLLARDNPRTNYNAWNSDIRAAYYNAIQWYVTGDSRHADKAVEIFNAWKNITSVTSNGTNALSAGIGYIMIEAAEIIKSTYTGWSAGDIQDFKDMLVYPGYSNTTVPSGNTTFYWKGYQGDPFRHGNQGLSGFRTVMAIGIFLDNEIIYDRVLRNVRGQSHRSYDFPYPSGPNTSTSISSSNDYVDTYNVNKGTSREDYGYDEVMTHYIYENGQCQESSRDHQHTAYGIGNLNSIAEMSWNQGDDLYSHANNRLLLGLEYNMRYNVSAVESYPDQTSPWEPTVASGEFLKGFDRTGRWYSKAMSTKGRAEIFNGVRPVFEMPIAHYVGRGFKTEDQAKWLIRARDRAIKESGFEDAGFSNDAIGWGALVARRVDGCYGDPISGFDLNGLPIYAMNILPMTIEAENYDYSPVSGEGRVYNDLSSNNSGNEYRTDESVDIEVCSSGGFNVKDIEVNEYLTYTVSVPADGQYNIAINYSGITGNGKLSISFDGIDKTGEVSLPSTGGEQLWDDLSIANNIELYKGVQSMNILVGGVSNSFKLNNITVSIANKINQTISSFDALPNNTEVGDDNINLFATASSGLPVTYISSDDNVASISNNEIQINGPGNITITASQKGNDGFNAAPDVIQEFQVSLEGSIIRIEAEDFFAMEGVKIEDTRDVDGVSNVGFIDTGDYMDYTVNIPFSGNYIVNYRVASPRNDNSVEFIANGISKITTDDIPNTGNWQDWTTITTAPISLTAGSQMIRLKIVSGGWNINWFELSPTNNVLSIYNSFELSKNIKIYPVPVSDVLYISNSKGSNIEILNSTGQLLLKREMLTNEESVNLNNLKQGIYLIKFINNNVLITKKVIKK